MIIKALPRIASELIAHCCSYPNAVRVSLPHVCIQLMKACVLYCRRVWYPGSRYFALCSYSGVGNWRFLVLSILRRLRRHWCSVCKLSLNFSGSCRSTDVCSERCPIPRVYRLRVCNDCYAGSSSVPLHPPRASRFLTWIAQMKLPIRFSSGEVCVGANSKTFQNSMQDTVLQSSAHRLKRALVPGLSLN